MNEVRTVEQEREKSFIDVRRRVVAVAGTLCTRTCQNPLVFLRGSIRFEVCPKVKLVSRCVTEAVAELLPVTSGCRSKPSLHFC